MTHLFYGCLKMLIFKHFIKYLPLHLIRWKFLGKKIHTFEIGDSTFEQLNIQRLVMFYNLKLLFNWRSSGGLNIGLISHTKKNACSTSGSIKLSFFIKFSMDFAKTYTCVMWRPHKTSKDLSHVANWCKKGTASFVLIGYVVHELSQKSWRGVNTPPSPAQRALIKNYPQNKLPTKEFSGLTSANYGWLLNSWLHMIQHCLMNGIWDFFNFHPGYRKDENMQW